MTTAAFATGRSTLTLLFNMGVMTMKMIRSTSITSTMGVTLMLELTFLPSARLLIPIIVCPVRSFAASAVVAVMVTAEDAPSEPVRLPASEGHAVRGEIAPLPLGRAIFLAVALLDEVVHQLAGAVVHLDVEGLH